MKWIQTSQIHRLDMMALAVFVATMRHRKTTVVGQQLGLTQSAVSHVLARLREVFEDELFIRRQNGVEPTSRALELEPKVTHILGLLENLQNEDAFNPSETSRNIRFGAVDYEATSLIGPLSVIMLRDAPKMSLSMGSFTRKTIIEQILENGLDVGLGIFFDLPNGILQETVYEDSYAVIAREGHSAVTGGTITIETYQSCRHVVVAGSGGSYGALNAALSAQNIKRNVALEVPLFLPALAALSQTDLIATVPRRFAARCAATYGLQVLDVPVETPSFPVSIVFHRRAAQDSGIKWFKSQLRAIAVMDGLYTRSPAVSRAGRKQDTVGA